MSRWPQCGCVGGCDRDTRKVRVHPHHAPSPPDEEGHAVNARLQSQPPGRHESVRARWDARCRGLNKAAKAGWPRLRTSSSDSSIRSERMDGSPIVAATADKK
eukprot:scaffold207328_cov27-Tisochrysis_lutea.AAC.2